MTVRLTRISTAARGCGCAASAPAMTDVTFKLRQLGNGTNKTRSIRVRAGKCGVSSDRDEKKRNVKKQIYLFEGDDADEAADAGDVGVVQAQQGEDGVGLREKGKQEV